MTSMTIYVNKGKTTIATTDMLGNGERTKDILFNDFANDFSLVSYHISPNLKGFSAEQLAIYLQDCTTKKGVAEFLMTNPMLRILDEQGMFDENGKKIITELTKDQLGNTTTVRENSQRFQDIVKISLDKIVIREISSEEGFNTREVFGDIEGLSKSLLENGQSQPGIVDVLKDGKFSLVDGHRRFAALKMLEEKGHSNIMFKAVVNTQKTTEEQRIIQMFTSQDNKPLEPHEVARIFQRLVNLGYSQSDIAKKTGKSASYVSQMLAFEAEPEAIKKEVRAGNLSVAAALTVKKTIKSTSERVAKVQEAVGNKGKVTAIDITGKQLSPCSELLDLLMEALDVVEVTKDCEDLEDRMRKAIDKHQKLYK